MLSLGACRMTGVVCGAERKENVSFEDYEKAVVKLVKMLIFNEFYIIVFITGQVQSQFQHVCFGQSQMKLALTHHNR